VCVKCASCFLRLAIYWADELEHGHEMQVFT
jgi:hypothetical protein